MKKKSILIIDDDPVFRQLTAKALTGAGCQVELAESVAAARALFAERTYDLMLLDIKLPDGDGISLLKQIREVTPETVVLMITGFASVENAVEAMRLGAYDYLAKPCDNEEILLKVQRAFTQQDLTSEVRALKKAVAERYRFGELVGHSEAMQEVYQLIEQVANTDATVLLVGDTGTGKELAAKAIHYRSRRAEQPFVVVNCSVFSENLLEDELFGHVKGAFTGAHRDRKGRFELAEGGTLFLDEVGDIPAAIQVKLLRALQEKEFERVGGTETLRPDVRILAATHRDLTKAIQEERMRTDFYYRINVFPIRLPSLRERHEDIPLLVDHFLAKYCDALDRPRKSVSPQVLDQLTAYPWPGNVRELEHAIEKAVITSREPVIAELSLPEPPPGLADLNPAPLDAGDYREFERKIVEEAAREYFRRLLKRYRGNISQVAAQAGLDRKTIYRKIESLGFTPEEFRG